MLTRNKKKRTTGNDVVDVEKKVTMDHGGTSDGVDNDYQQTNYLQVAWLLRKKLNELLDGDNPREIQELGLRSLLDMAASRNIVFVDPKMMSPVLWRTLPKELLLHVLARLPVRDITRLRSLSKEWRTDLATVNSEINQACQEISSTMVALLSHSSTHEFFVTIYDITKCKWKYTYQLHLQGPWNDNWEQWPFMWTGVDACDGGLVCFILLRKPTMQDRLCIVVVNVLTRVQHELPPPHYKYSTLPAMVQIKVDFDTKCYTVSIAAYVKGRPAVEVYDSSTRQWTTAPLSGFIFGRVHNWTSTNGWCRKFSATPGAYDFAKGKLERHYKKHNPSTGKAVIDWVLEREQMFVLHDPEQTQMVDASFHRRRRVHHDFCITEYHLEDQTTKAWVEGKSYACPFFAEDLLEAEQLSMMRLRRCEGFLMVIVHHGEISPYFWLLDLCTSEWRNLPEHSTLEGLHTPGAMLCRAFWNVVP